MKTSTLLVAAPAALAAGFAIMFGAQRLGWIGGATPDDRIATGAVAAAPPSVPSTTPPEPTVRVAANDVPRSQRAPSGTCDKVANTIQLESPTIARRAGFAVETVTAQTLRDTVRCSAAIAFDGDRYAHLAARAPGIIAEVRADLGSAVVAGDVMAIVDSAAVGSAQAALLQARSLVELHERTFERERVLSDKGVARAQDVLEAETTLVESRIELANARQRLRNLGLSGDDLATIVERGTPSSLLPLTAPFAGIVVERHAVAGEVISTERPLFSIADTTRVWAMLDVYEDDLARLASGQQVSIALDGLPGRAFEGELTWISASVDPRTRTLKARAELSNTDGLLRANMFGRAEIAVAVLDDAVLVPESAVQWEGCCNVVFVRHTDTIYQPYQVTLGSSRDGYALVRAGLPSGEQVVTRGSYLLKTELLKGNIGAGCCEVDPGATR